MDKKFEGVQEIKDVNLEFKEHRDFFELYYIFKKEFVISLNKAYLDFSIIPIAFENLFIFVSNANAQIQLKMSLKDIQESRNNIINLIRDKKNLAALNEMETFFSDVCKICMELELESKPTFNEDTDATKFWKDEKHQALKEIKKAFSDILLVEQ